jgi:two-component system OmpR family response regulator
MKVILVEDHYWVVLALTQLLRELAGVEVAKVLNSEDEAVNWLMHNSVAWDMAVVDLALGQGSGLRVLSACRVRKSHQKVVVLSNHLDAEMRRRCLTLGADAVFKKSSDIDAMTKYCQGLIQISLNNKSNA